MKLSLKNVGKIRDAEIKIDGITVIAGENDTGKSTVGKSLYTIFNSFFDLDKQIMNSRCEMIEDVIMRGLNYPFVFEEQFFDIAQEILKRGINLDKENLADFGDKLREYLSLRDEENKTISISDENLMDMSEKINQILNVSSNEIFKRILQSRIDGEFRKQLATISNERTESHIGLNIKDSNMDVKIIGAEIINISFSTSLRTQAIYVDNPLIMDQIGSYPRGYLKRLKKRRTIMSHRDYLKACLINDDERDEVERVIDEIIVDNQIKEIEDIINKVCKGEFKRNKYYEDRTGSGISLDIHNVSAGIKIFMVIKQLLRNKMLSEKGILILDEPEVYLHPKWQLVFAEIIVLLQKKYDLHILLTTHSPYFLRAVEVFAGKNGMADRCNYYLAEKVGRYAGLKDVTNNTEEIYKKLLEPFEMLQMETYQND